MGVYRRFVKDASIVAAAEVITKLRPLIFLPILTLFLTVSEYGVYVTLLTTSVFLVPFSSIGARFGIIRLLASEKDDSRVSQSMSSITALTIIVASGISLVVFLLAPLLANTVFGSPESADVIRVGSLLILAQALFDNVLAFFLMRQRVLAYSIFMLAENFFPVAAGTTALLLGGGFLDFITFYVIAELLLNVVGHAAIVFSVGFKRPRLRHTVPFIRFGAPMIGNKISGTVLSIGDRYIIGAFMGAAYVGMYSVAYTLGTSVLMFVGPVHTAIVSHATKSFDEDRHHEVRGLLRYASRYFLMFAIPAAVGITMLSTKLINSLTNSSFLNKSFEVTALIAVASLFFGLYSLESVVVYLRKKTKFSAILLTSLAAINVIANLVLVPVYGLVGAAIATLVCFVGLFAAMHLFCRELGADVQLIFVLKSIAASAVMGLLVMWLDPSGWFRILVTSLLCAATYFALLFALGGIEKKEIAVIARFLRKKLLKKSRSSGGSQDGN